MSLVDPDPTRPPLVLLGKTKPRVDELVPLRNIGTAMAHVDRIWTTTPTPGAPELIHTAYENERQRLGRESLASFLQTGAQIPTHQYVLVFSDAKFIRTLESKVPEYLDYHWYLVHNPRETKLFLKHLLHTLSEAGIRPPQEDGG